MSKGTLNKVILIGRLGGDPELRYTPNGAAVTSFNMATNESYKDKDGKQVDQTDWHRIVAWRKLAEICGQYLKKGSLVYIEGKIKTRSYDDKDGVKRYVTEIVADNMQMLDSRRDAGGGAPPAIEPVSSSSESTATSSTDDDLPF